METSKFSISVAAEVGHTLVTGFLWVLVTWEAKDTTSGGGGLKECLVSVANLGKSQT